MAWITMLNYNTSTVDYLEVEDGDYDDYLINETLIANHINPDEVATMVTDYKPKVYNICTDECTEVFDD